MGDNQYNKYPNEYQNAHYQVKANVSGNNGASQQFSYDVNQYVNPGPYESNTHLSGLSNCVKSLQTHLNQYLTKIIDEGSEGNSGNYNLGSGEVLNSHLMEHYSSGNTPNTASAFQAESPANNGYSYYSNYPPNYSNYHHQPPPQAPYGAPEYYSQQYSNFQEPKPKKQKNK